MLAYANYSGKHFLLPSRENVFHKDSLVNSGDSDKINHNITV